ncbi:uncharacterized protein ARMOST_16214 [Armillaria ostoyae]|uniref:Uncharacterized protein n=1 Tax=Armillaria ostoyae TaxID=47428 RepID=A0A284RVK5_ARMOS|nr:uncharacterized protein ARMOST_16214 [Armillaria ostoyae]
MEERYDEAMSRHEEWKTAKAKEAQAEKLRQKLEKEKKRLWLEAKEEQRKLDLAKKEQEKAMAKKILEKEKKDEDNEKWLAATSHQLSGSERDSESDPADLKTNAMVKLRRRHRIAEGKKKKRSVEAQKHKFQSASVVESGGEDGNTLVGPSVPKCLKTEPAPMAQDKVFTGSGHCGKCCTDKTICFICSGVRTCQQCRIKKARCTFNKSEEDSSTVESPSILELLQDISSRLMCLEDKVDVIAGHVEDLVNNYDVNNEVKYSEDFIPKSVQVEFKALRLELRKVRNIYCEILHEVAKHRLDRDMALIKAEGLQVLASEMPLRVDDPYEILNKLFWIGTVSATSLCNKMLACNKFLQAHWDFYNEGYRVEDLDEPLDLKEEICNNMIPGAESVGILDLDVMIKMLMPKLDPEEEAEKEHCRQEMAKLRAKKCEKGEAVESEIEMYEDLEPVSCLQHV